MPFSPVTKFVSGDPIMVDHTPAAGTNIGAGDVVAFGGGSGANAGLGSCRIAHNDISATVLGSLSMGFGIYDVAKTNAASSGVTVTAAGAAKLAYWDTANKQVVSTTNGGSGTTTFLGQYVASCADADTTARILHLPK